MSAVDVSQKLDRRQLRALLGVFRKNEWRGGMNPLTQKRGGAFSGLLGVIGLNVFLSLAVTAFIIKAPTMQSGIILGGLFVSVIVAFQVLLEYGKTIIAAEDYSIIAPLPVSSKTFYIAKQIHFLMHVTVVTLSLSLAPIIGVIVIGGSVALGIETLIVFWLSGVFASPMVSIVYTLMLSTKHPQKLERILGYAQVMLSMVFTLMYFWFSRLIPILENLDIDAVPYFKLAPSYWFAALFRLALEGWQTDMALIGILGIVVFAAMYYLTANNLSLTYAQSLLRTGLSSGSIRSTRNFPLAKRLWRQYFAPETRAVLMLMRAQFRGDVQFRMQTLVMIPFIVLFFLYLAFSGDGISDPFLPSAEKTAGPSNTFIVLMMLPMTITMAVFYSAAYKAAWIFYSSPINRLHVLTGSRTATALVFLCPLFVGLSILFTYFFGNPFHALLHALFIVMIIRIPVAVIVLLNPCVPFSLPMASANKLSLKRMLGMFVPMFFLIPVVVVEYLGYGGYLGYALILGATLVFIWALGVTTDPYLERRFKTWEFLS